MDVVVLKLTQPLDAERAEDRGRGWSELEIVTWLEQMLTEVHAVGRTFMFDDDLPPRPLPGVEDYEDACVYALFRAAISHADCETQLVTYDRNFAIAVNAAAPIGQGGRPLWGAVSATDLLRRLAMNRSRIEDA